MAHIIFEKTGVWGKHEGYVIAGVDENICYPDDFYVYDTRKEFIDAYQITNIKRYKDNFTDGYEGDSPDEILKAHLTNQGKRNIKFLASHKYSSKTPQMDNINNIIDSIIDFTQNYTDANIIQELQNCKISNIQESSKSNDIFIYFKFKNPKISLNIWLKVREKNIEHINSLLTNNIGAIQYSYDGWSLTIPISASIAKQINNNYKNANNFYDLFNKQYNAASHKYSTDKPNRILHAPILTLNDIDEASYTSKSLSVKQIVSFLKQIFPNLYVNMTEANKNYDYKTDPTQKIVTERKVKEGYYLTIETEKNGKEIFHGFSKDYAFLKNLAGEVFRFVEHYQKQTSHKYSSTIITDTPSNPIDPNSPFTIQEPLDEGDYISTTLTYLFKEFFGVKIDILNIKFDSDNYIISTTINNTKYKAGIHFDDENATVTIGPILNDPAYKYLSNKHFARSNITISILDKVYHYITPLDRKAIQQAYNTMIENKEYGDYIEVETKRKRWELTRINEDEFTITIYSYEARNYGDKPTWNREMKDVKLIIKDNQK